MDKIINVLKKQGLAILGLFIMGGYGWVSNLIEKGRDVERKDEIINVIKGEASTKYINTLAREAIDTEMNDPFALIDILSSDHVSKFAESKAIEVKEQVQKELFKSDSLKGDFVHALGEGTGIRNDEVMNELIQLLKDFKAGKLTSSRTVRANF